jgi:hypothetical protein
MSNIHVNRRQILGLIGTSLVAPTLFVKEIKASNIKRIDVPIITGIDMIDCVDLIRSPYCEHSAHPLDGIPGLPRGSVIPIFGRTGSGKSIFTNTIARSAAKNVSVGVVTDSSFLKKNIDDNSEKFKGQLCYYADYQCDGAKAYLSKIEELAEKHDLIILENYLNLCFNRSTCHSRLYDVLGNEYRQVLKLARDYNVSIICEFQTQTRDHSISGSFYHIPYPLGFDCLRMSDLAFSMRKTGPWIGTGIFQAAMIKNRWGKRKSEFYSLNEDKMIFDELCYITAAGEPNFDHLLPYNTSAQLRIDAEGSPEIYYTGDGK